MISIDDFKKVEIKVGKILSAEKLLNSDKLIKLQVDFGGEAPVQILSGIAEFYEPESLVGSEAAFVTNLEPRTIRGEVSYGMILAAHGEKPIILKPSEDV